MLIKDIFEKQNKQKKNEERRVTKFILNFNTKIRIIRLNLLPLMMECELTDILLLVKSLKIENSKFKIHNYVDFYSSHTRSGSQLKLKHIICTLQPTPNTHILL